MVLQLQKVSKKDQKLGIIEQYCVEPSEMSLLADCDDQSELVTAAPVELFDMLQCEGNSKTSMENKNCACLNTKEKESLNKLSLFFKKFM